MTGRGALSASPVSAASSRDSEAPETDGSPLPPPAGIAPGNAAPAGVTASAVFRETEERSGQGAARVLPMEDVPGDVPGEAPGEVPGELPGELPGMPPPRPSMGPEQAMEPEQAMGPERAGSVPPEEPAFCESESPVPEGYADIEPDSFLPESPGNEPGAGKPFVWEDFVIYCSARKDISPGFLSVLRSQRAVEKDALLEITPDTAFSSGQLEGRIKSGYLAGLVRGYCGREYGVRLLPPAKRLRRMTELREELRAHPGVVLLEKQLGARMIDCGRIHNTGM